MKSGIQISSFKPVLRNEKEVVQCFEKMRRIGCGTIQIQWIDKSVSPAFIAESLGEIQNVSVQDFFAAYLEDRAYYDAIMDLTHAKWLCLSRIPQEYKSGKGLKRYSDALRAIQLELRNKGQDLCFHPTRPDYECIDGLYPVHYLMQENPELFLCLDLYHGVRAGENLEQLLRMYQGRICMVHFKDYKILGDGSEVLVPAGSGVIDYEKIPGICAESGVAYGFAEQESWERDPYEALEQAFRWLNRYDRAQGGK